MKCQIYWIPKSHQVLGQICQMSENSAAITTNLLTPNPLFLILFIPIVLPRSVYSCFFPLSPVTDSSASWHWFTILGKLLWNPSHLLTPSSCCPLLFSSDLCPSALTEGLFVSWTAFLVRWSIPKPPSLSSCSAHAQGETVQPQESTPTARKDKRSPNIHVVEVL